jgi:ABC-type sugar transport system ATPase subunit
MVLYEGVKVAERAIEETDLEDLVQLIVGERMRSREPRGADVRP